MNELKPMHYSKLRSRIRTPRKMARASLPADIREMVEEQSLGIFADMTNAGCSFQQALAAIFLSGMNAGKHAMAGEFSIEPICNRRK